MMTEAERRRRLSAGYGRAQREKRWAGREHTTWKDLVQREVLKLHRRGEKVDPALLRWAKGTQ